MKDLNQNLVDTFGFGDEQVYCVVVRNKVSEDRLDLIRYFSVIPEAAVRRKAGTVIFKGSEDTCNQILIQLNNGR
ncbi:MAG: hypothetical protein HC836_45025 [Richelia sp. RM2_1_2]|nr:hypothetical protein [Richelia sp. RM2_1_2]